MALRVVDQDLDRVEAHRLGVDEPDQELGRVEQLEEGQFVGRPGERRGVRLGEPEAGERRDLAEQLLGGRLLHPGLAHRALDELAMELLHLVAGAPRAHRAPEPVRFGRAEARDLDRDAHDLLLVEDHAHRILEHRLQAGVEVGHRLQALLAAQERVDGVALDGARPDDRHLHDQVVEVLRARLRERLHLRPALDLEDAHGVGRLEHLEHLRDVLGQAVQVETDRAVVLDELERLVHRGQHPEPQQVELDELQRLDVALVELDHDPIDHRGALDRRDVDERRGRHEHAARVDAEVPGETVDPGTELQPALPVAHPDRRAAAGLRGRLRLHAGHRRVGTPRALVGPPWGRRVPVSRPSELVGPARRRLGLAALRVDQPAGHHRGRHQPIALRRVARPLPARSQATLAGVPGPPSSSPAVPPGRRDDRCALDRRRLPAGAARRPPGARRRVAGRSGPPAPVAGARAAPSRRAGSACSAGPSRRRGRVPRQPRPRAPQRGVPRPSAGRTRRTRRRPRGRVGPSRCRTSRAPSPRDRRAAAGTRARSPPRAPPSAPGT